MQKTTSKLFFFLIFLIAIGAVVALTGIYGVDNSNTDTESFEDIHKFEKSDTNADNAKSTLYGGLFSYNFQETQVDPVAPTTKKGVSVGEIMRWAGVLAVLTAIIILLLIEFVYRDRINKMNYRMLLIISLFVLPVIVGLGTSATVLETTKTVESCGSCHVMDPFVNDLQDPGSTTLAARHYKNKWIADYQCYTCHTTYGAHGTLAGKRDGFRHWLLFVTQTWDEPISYSGSYPNMNCTACHAGTTSLQEVQSHQALSSKLRANEVSCTSCHGPTHPTPNERDDVPKLETTTHQTAPNEINTEKLSKLMETIDE